MTKKASILIVEDESNIRSLLNDYLSHLGFEIYTASNAEEGLQAFKDKNTDFLISDIRMKGDIDGIDVVRRIKAFMPNTKIIVITGYSEEIERIENIVHALFIKPFELDDLKNVLEENLNCA